MAITPDGHYFISTSSKHSSSNYRLKVWRLKVWDLERETNLGVLKGHTGVVTALTVTPDGRQLISGGTDKTIKVWDLERFKKLLSLRSHNSNISTVTASPDGWRAVSVATNGNLRVWDLSQGAELRHLGLSGVERPSRILGLLMKVWARAHRIKPYSPLVFASILSAAAVTPDGQQVISDSYRLYSSSQDRDLKVWDLKSGKQLRTLAGDASKITMMPDARHFIAISHNILAIRDLQNGEMVTSFTADGSLGTCAVSPDGSTIVAGESSGRVHLLRLNAAVMPGNDVSLEPLPLASSAVSSFAEPNVVSCPNCWTTGDVRPIIKGYWFIVFFLLLLALAVGLPFQSLWWLFFSIPIGSYAVRSIWLRFTKGDLHQCPNCKETFLYKRRSIPPSPPIVTAFQASADTNPTFGCPLCRMWSVVPVSALGAKVSCAHCGRTIKLNSFLIDADWRPVAQAWRGNISGLK